MSKSEAATQMKDRRTARRYDLSLPVIVRALIDKDAPSRTGKIRDIPTRGVYFTIDDDISANAELNLKMIFPVEVSNGGSEVFIEALGKVVRVDRRPGNGDRNVDVAAAFEMYEIVRNE